MPAQQPAARREPGGSADCRAPGLLIHTATAAGRLPPRSAPGLWHKHLPERVEILHALAGTQYHGIKRVVGHVEGHARLLAHELIPAATQSSAPGWRRAAYPRVTP